MGNKYLYIYLLKRDKTEVKILAKIPSNGDQSSTRIDKVDFLNLNLNATKKINQSIYENRMLWEPWIETFYSYLELKTKLKKRGLKKFPLSGEPQVYKSNEILIKSNLKNSVMIRKS